MASYRPPPSYPTAFQAPPASFLFNPPTSSSSRRPLNPFLGPRAHLSLSWLSQHFLALLLVLIALAFLLASIPGLVTDGKDALNSACSGVEGAASVAVSLPHYMAGGVNEMNVKAVRAVTDGAATVMDLTLYAMEKIIIFMIDIYRSLFLCLLDLAVHGSITVLVSGIEEAQEFLEDALGGIRTAIQSTVEGINTALNSTLGFIDDIPGVDIDIPQVDIPELSSLGNVTLPDTLVDALRSLNSSIPTYDELKEQMASLISTPIDALRSEINGTFGNASSTISIELLPVPDKETVQICQDLDTSWIDSVGHDLGSFVKLMIGLTILAMVFLIAGSALWERYRYRVFLGGVASAREAWLADLLSSSSHAPPNSASSASMAEDTLSTRNLLSFLNASSHPTLFSHVQRLTSLFRLRTSNAKANLIWFLSYIAHPYAWAFLAFGLMGIVVVQIQLAVLNGPVRSMVNKRAETGANEFSTSVTDTLNSKMNETSVKWAVESNAVIEGFQDTINEDVFGWVNTTTTAVNTTINAFYGNITDSLTDVFNGTILEDPVLDLVYCLIGSKVDSLSTALTWLHDNLHISLPTVSPSFLLLSSNQSAELSSSLTNPNSTYSAPSIAEKMINSYEKNLKQQRMVFLLAIGIWGLVLVFGAIGVLWRNRQANKPVEDEAVDGPTAGGADEKRFFGGGGAGRRIRMKPLHLRSASSFFASPHLLGRSRGGVDDAVLDEPPSPAYALFPHPGETSTTNLHAVPSRDGRELYGSGRSWASLVDFFRPTIGAPPSSSSPYPAATSSSVRARSAVASSKLKAAISLPRPRSTSGFAPTSFPGRRRAERVSAKVREMKGRMEEKREERRRRLRSSIPGGANWEKMQDEVEEKREEQQQQQPKEESALPPANPPPELPLPPLPFSHSPADPFGDLSAVRISPSSPPPPLPSRNPFSDPLSPSPFSPSLPPQHSPSATTNPFLDSSAAPFSSPVPYASRPVLPITSHPLSPPPVGGTNPFLDPHPFVSGRAL
ncbi:hypothetical protein JCM8547_005136 [Rhodosporidiobolus lusitaniae]